MATLPRTNEDPRDRKLRIIEEEIDRLKSLIPSKPADNQLQLPPANEELPNAVGFAASFLIQTRNQLVGRTVEQFAATTDFDPYELRASEEGAVDAAADLLRSYFERHDANFLEDRQRIQALEEAEGQESEPDATTEADPDP